MQPRDMDYVRFFHCKKIIKPNNYEKYSAVSMPGIKRS